MLVLLRFKRPRLWNSCLPGGASVARAADSQELPEQVRVHVVNHGYRWLHEGRGQKNAEVGRGNAACGAVCLNVRTCKLQSYNVGRYDENAFASRRAHGNQRETITIVFMLPARTNHPPVQFPTQSRRLHPSTPTNANGSLRSAVIHTLLSLVHRVACRSTTSRSGSHSPSSQES